MKRKIGMILVFTVFSIRCFGSEEATFSGSSDSLQQTQIIMSLGEPVDEHKNVVWCASFLAAWKALQNDLIREPVKLADAKKMSDRLNESPDVREDIPPESIYATAGWVAEGIIDTIQQHIRKMFPVKQIPEFPGIDQNSFLAYSYLTANIPFSLPYFQNDEPLIFTDSNGKKTEINSFGIRKKDDYAYWRLRTQLEVLFKKGEGTNELEFAIDMCRESNPSQIVVSRIAPESSLAATLAKIDRCIAEVESLKISDPDEAIYIQRFKSNDVLLVPDIFWQIAHHFTELEGKSFGNSKLKGQKMDVALQEISFRLDRSGAELSAQEKEYCYPIPTHFVLDRPFLVYIKTRGHKHPYFVMWVDNAELLTPWDEKLRVISPLDEFMNFH